MLQLEQNQNSPGGNLGPVRTPEAPNYGRRAAWNNYLLGATSGLTSYARELPFNPETITTVEDTVVIATMAAAAYVCFKQAKKIFQRVKPYLENMTLGQIGTLTLAGPFSSTMSFCSGTVLTTAPFIHKQMVHSYIPSFDTPEQTVAATVAGCMAFVGVAGPFLYRMMGEEKAAEHFGYRMPATIAEPAEPREMHEINPKAPARGKKVEGITYNPGTKMPDFK